MAQKTFVAGDVLTAADVNTYLAGEGGAWTSWTPTLTQSGTVTKTVNRAVYARYGRTIIFHAYMTVTGSGTGSNSIIVGLPVTASSSLAMPIGSAFLFDQSTGNYYGGAARIVSTTTMDIQADGIGTQLALGAGVFTGALAVNDVISLSGIYEAAS